MYKAAYYRRNRIRILAAQKKYGQANGWKYQRKYERSHREVPKKHKLMKRYGITQDTYDALWREQDGRCYVCGQHETWKHRVTQRATSLCVDHDHTTRKVRRLLCRRCNMVIGHVLDNPALLEKLASYLRIFGDTRCQHLRKK